MSSSRWTWSSAPRSRKTMNSTGRALARSVPLLVLVLLSGSWCRPQPKAAKADSTGLAARAARVDQALAQPDTGKGKDEPIARWVLPARLAEISGLAVTANGRLLAHNDEQGVVAEIDYRHGTIVKQFLVGSPPLRGDFEGITVAGDAIFLLASNGKLYEFREGANGARVQYTVHDPQLGKECEFEGVAFEPASDSFLLACKTVAQKSLRDYLVIYRWKRGSSDGSGISDLKVPLAQVIGSHKWKEVRPTDITVDPRNGNYVLVAALQRALIELTPAGEVRFARALPGRHAQAEGVAVTKDGVLIVSDEAGQRPASITLYRFP
jgi:uncharacterized protein YjiK